MEALNALKAKMEEMKKEMAQAGKEALAVEFKRLFEEWPEAQAIRWTQYTPYFNDGEPCVFSVNDAYVKTGSEDGDYEDGFVDEYHFYDYKTKEKSHGYEHIHAINGALRACEGVLQSLFGDHCRVTVWRDKSE